MTAPAPSIRDRVVDALERAGSAAGEQFLAVVTVGTGVTRLTGLPWEFALLTSLGAAVISILLTAVQFSLVGPVSFRVDLLIRTAKSFAASLLATFGGDHPFNIVGVSWTDALDVAAMAAVLTVVKCLLSPNAHLSGSLLSTQTVARLHGVAVEGGSFHRQ